ncbi:MAG TPA: hypothetical protein VK448_01015 [Dissulfurispiraceae bacterium]|nr:hypothetical protein [Dissulfurispiraceae bacterium]
MFTHSGGTAVAKGMYWSPLDGGRVHMRDSGILPGDRGRSYLRLSPVILLLIAPLFGVTFAFFLPLLGLGVLAVLCMLLVSTALSTVASTAVRICCSSRTSHASPRKREFTGSYRPLRASFTGAHKRKKGKG